MADPYPPTIICQLKLLADIAGRLVYINTRLNFYVLQPRINLKRPVRLEFRLYDLPPSVRQALNIIED